MPKRSQAGGPRLAAQHALCKGGARCGGRGSAWLTGIGLKAPREDSVILQSARRVDLETVAAPRRLRVRLALTVDHVQRRREKLNDSCSLQRVSAVV